MFLTDITVTVDLAFENQLFIFCPSSEAALEGEAGGGGEGKRGGGGGGGRRSTMLKLFFRV